MTCDLHAPTRRHLLLASGTLFAWAYLPKVARAEGRDPRLLVIVLRGALDGLAAVAPVGDPDWITLRGDKALTLDGKPPALPLDSFFALNPAMPNLHRLYKAGAATSVHATATSYRERSHFDGQDVLESGLGKPGASDTGWLNRALASLQPAGRAGQRSRSLRWSVRSRPWSCAGRHTVLSWTPRRLPPASDDTLTRLLDLYQHTDPALARVLEDAWDLRPSRAQAAWTGSSRGRPAPEPVRAYFAESAAPRRGSWRARTGPRIGALAFDGWDTHAAEGANQWPARYAARCARWRHRGDRDRDEGTPGARPSSPW